MASADQQFLTLKLKVEVLAGERGDPRQAAIRMSYLTQLQELIGKLKKSASDIQVVVDAIGADVELVKTDVSFIQADIGVLKTNVVEITTDLAHVQNGLNQANDDLGDLQQGVTDLQIDVAGLSGVIGEVDVLQMDMAIVKSEVTAIRTNTGAVVIPTPQQGNVSDIPTAAQFNKAVADILALKNTLDALKAAID